MSTHASIVRHDQKRILTGVVIIAVLIVLPAVLFGQGYFGTVSGELTDASGAVVQGARVILSDQQKGFTFKTTSDNGGRFLFRSIPPGLYSVTVDLAGFEKSVVQNHVKVDVNENATANLSLKVASAAQTIQVEAQKQTIATEDAVTGQVINRKFINDLPLVDRNVMNLTYLSPGVTDMDDQCPNCGATNFVSNGSRGASSDILMDGASVTNFEPNGGVTEATYQPSPDAVEEFKVQQTNFSAEFGFSGASVINLVTRSGSNAFHGSAYEYLRNQVLDANGWFANHFGDPIPPLKRNQFGGTIGGPIIKNKTFFFFDFDGTRQNTMSSYQAGVPSDLERAGDFGEVCGAQGGDFDSSGMCSVAAGQIWDPYTGVYDPTAPGAVRSSFIPFNNVATYTSPGNSKLNGTPYQLAAGPGNLIDPVAQKMMSYFPEPNIDGGTIYDNFFASGANYGSNNQFDIKVDHRFSEKNLMSVRYSQEWSSGSSYSCFGNLTDPCAGGPSKSTAHIFSVNDTHTISPTLLLTTTFGFTRGAFRLNAYNGDDADPLGTLGFPSYLQSNGFKGVPAMFVGGGYFSAGYTSMGNDPYGNYKQGKDTAQLGVTLNKVKGAHDIKFGFEGRLHQMNYIQTNAPLGIFNFDEHGTSACPNDFDTCGGDAMASFLTGQTGSGYYEIQFEPATENFQYATFAQDNWKTTKKLTLNIGLRYDVSLPRTDRHNRQNWFDPTVVSPIQVAGLPTLHGGEVFANDKTRNNYATDWKDFQPRFGFAYQLTPGTVMRGGYGIYYGQSRSGASGVVPYGSQGFNQYTNMVTSYQNDGATPYLRLSNPYPNGLIQPAGSSLGLLNDVGFGANGPLRNTFSAQNPYEQSWSFGVERQLPWNVLINAEYIGKKGTHLPFSGSNQLNILGPQIESYTPDQIDALNSFVDNPFFGIITDPNSVLSSPQIQAFQLMVPFPQFPDGVSTDVKPIASSIYHGLQLVAEKRYTNGLQFLVSYTWSKSIDDSSVADDNVM